MQDYKVFQRLANVLKDFDGKSLSLKIGLCSYCVTRDRKTLTIRFEKRHIGEKAVKKNPAFCGVFRKQGEKNECKGKD